MNIIMKLIPLALVALVSAAPAPQTASGQVGQGVTLTLSDGSTKALGTLVGFSGASLDSTCLSLPADDSWTGLAVASGPLSTAATGTACAHTQVFAYRGDCPTTDGTVPDGTARLLGTDGKYLLTSFVRGDDVMTDSLSVAISCLSALPATADQQEAAIAAADAVLSPGK
ncbi:hypothetical protein NA57DRAFT_71675 [Rhizodiscina lignyota]|uniref:Uncharacterized protein n=1 Tax=Rhizodiscina lignyota TaxID=1504668 RepID=A0A9P4M9D8_9PEZI|nr:hypothetical protein NA57DRAFT_71675 [Rhizodiscina lignyota]